MFNGPVSEPDFEAIGRLVVELDGLAKDWQARGEALSAALAAGSVQIERPWFRLRSEGSRITELTFTAAAPTTSPTQLRGHVLAAYAEAAVSTNRSTAQALASAGWDADAVTATVEEDLLTAAKAEPTAPPAPTPRPAVAGTPPEIDDVDSFDLD